MPHRIRNAARYGVAALALFTTLLLGASQALAAARTSSEAADRAMAEASRAALSVDIPAALDALARVPAEQFVGKDARVRNCMIRTFGSADAPPPVSGIDDPFARAVVAAYRRYWWHVLRQPERRQALESRLGADLAGLLDLPPPENTEAALDRLVERIGDALRERGLYAQQGRTPPLHELLLWSTQQPRDYSVALPEGFEQPVRVFILEDFLSNGWTHYARCGMRGPGGWANPEGLYAVRHRYDSLESEEFKVSFLGHEAQHFADLRRWPDMPSWQLEYRAKLTQLVLADQSLASILETFVRTRTDDRSLPHPYANSRVVRDLMEALELTSPADLASTAPANIRRVARELLVRDTEQREPPR